MMNRRPYHESTVRGLRSNVRAQLIECPPQRHGPWNSQVGVLVPWSTVREWAVYGG